MRYSNLFILFLFVLSCFSTKGQDSLQQSTPYKTHLLKANLFPFHFGVEFEYFLKKDISFGGRVFESIGYGMDNFGLTKKYFIRILPSYSFEARKYYNMKKRVEKNRNTLKKSFNYFMVRAMFPIGDRERNYTYYSTFRDNLLFFMHGWKRRISNGFYIEWEAGIVNAFYYSKSYSYEQFFIPMVFFNIGYDFQILRKKKYNMQ